MVVSRLFGIFAVIKENYIMSKKLLNITERELMRVVKETTRQVLSEMAVGRKDYIQYGINQSATVLKHIGKICVYENDALMNHWVWHWENEIAAQIYDLGRIDITNDNKSCKIKKKAFVLSFIEARLGKNLSEYDEKMPLYIKEGLEDEGLTKEQIKSIDIEKISAANKERIWNYLMSFVDLLSIRDWDELKEQVKSVAHQF